MKKEMIYDYLKPELVEYPHFGKIAEGESGGFDPGAGDPGWGDEDVFGDNFGVDGF